MEHLLCECELLKVIAAEAWGCPNRTPQLWSHQPFAKTGVGANQHHLQYSTSIATFTHMRQDYSEHFVALNTGNQERHKLQTDKSAPSVQQVTAIQ